MADQSATYLNFNELSAKLGNRGRTTLYRDLDQRRHQQPIKIGSRLYWLEAAVDQHLLALRSFANSKPAPISGAGGL